MRSLQVTSPPIRGREVKQLQALLNGRNVLERDFLQGAVDGEFGPETARACKRAKFWLGYPETEMRGTAGDALRDMLTGRSTIPDVYARRARARATRAKQKPLRLKALERAARDVGKLEKPRDSNRISITARWGVIGPYCAMGVSEWYIDVGSVAFTLGDDYAFCPFLLADAHRGRNHLSLVRAEFAQPGDIFVADWAHDGVADHTGLLRSTVRKDGSFLTREANTSPSNRGSQSNGGGVYDRERNVNQVAKIFGARGFIHVGK